MVSFKMLCIVHSGVAESPGFVVRVCVASFLSLQILTHCQSISACVRPCAQDRSRMRARRYVTQLPQSPAQPVLVFSAAAERSQRQRSQGRWLEQHLLARLGHCCRPSFIHARTRARKAAGWNSYWHGRTLLPAPHARTVLAVGWNSRCTVMNGAVMNDMVILRVCLKTVGLTVGAA